MVNEVVVVNVIVIMNGCGFMCMVCVIEVVMLIISIIEGLCFISLVSSVVSR